jgi:hypothetical protein
MHPDVPQIRTLLNDALARSGLRIPSLRAEGMKAGFARSVEYAVYEKDLSSLRIGSWEAIENPPSLLATAPFSSQTRQRRSP